MFGFGNLPEGIRFPPKTPIDVDPIILQGIHAGIVIREKVAKLPWIGAQKGGVVLEGNGFYQEYDQATIWTVSGTDLAFEVHGDIRNYHVSIGQGKSIVGLPLSDETPCGDNRGWFNTFQNGVIYWTAQTGSHEVYGMIFKQWSDLGKEKSWLGYPLTGEKELPGHHGRINSFENGQITWKNGQLATINFRDTMMQKYKNIGGIRSSMGLPWDLSLPITRNGNHVMMAFRGGNVSIPLTSPTPNATTTQTVTINFVGLECVSCQEKEDETSGAVSCFCPSTINIKPVSFADWRFKDGVRIMPTRSLIYEGPPADVLISTSLVELDISAGNPMAVANKIVGVMNDSFKFLADAGGVIRDDNIATAWEREGQVIAQKYKDITNSTLWTFLVKMFDSPDDPYQPGFLQLKSYELKSRSLPKKLLRRGDGGHTITYTEAIPVTGVDNGGDRGNYTFYFDVDVRDVQIPV